MAFVFVVEYAMGWVKITGAWALNVPDVSLLFALSFSVVKVLCVGTYEEFVARNLFQGAVFGCPVSGDKDGASVIAIQQLGSSVLTGGNFGAEAGIIEIIASLIGIGSYVVLYRGKKPAAAQRPVYARHEDQAATEQT
jgi:hypothetical protein